MLKILWLRFLSWSQGLDLFCNVVER